MTFSFIQPEQLNYTDTDKSHALDMQDKIERTLKEKIMEWRPKNITRWNRYCIQAFRHLLPKWVVDRSDYQYLEDLQRVWTGEQMHSWLLSW